MPKFAKLLMSDTVTLFAILYWGKSTFCSCMSQFKILGAHTDKFSNSEKLTSSPWLVSESRLLSAIRFLGKILFSFVSLMSFSSSTAAPLGLLTKLVVLATYVALEVDVGWMWVVPELE